jgi:hypothetical protein
MVYFMAIKSLQTREVKSGQNIVFWLRETVTLEDLYPTDAIVLRVYPGVLVVAESDSRNGLAIICSYGVSPKDSLYCYEYGDKYGQSVQYFVTQIEDDYGRHIEAPFIETS